MKKLSLHLARNLKTLIADDTPAEVVVRLRTIYMLAVVLYPAWWFLYDHVLGPAQSATLLEYGLVAFHFGIWVIISKTVPFVQKRMRFFHWIPVLVFTFHHFWIMHRDHLTIAHTIGAFVAVGSAIATFSAWKDVATYSVIVLVYSFTFWNHTGPVHPEMLIIGLATTLLVTHVANLDRLRLIQSLKKSEQQLKESNEKKIEILQSIQEGFATLDRDFKVTYVNPVAEKILNFEAGFGHYLGNTLWDLFPNRFNSAIGDALRRAMDGEAVEIQERSLALDKWLELRIYPNESGISVFIRDVSERKKMETAIAEQEMKAIVAAKMSTLGEMAGGVAHEINNPLAIIRVKAQQLIEESEETDQVESSLVKKAAEKIDATVLRISKIVKALRSFARDGDKDPFEVTSIQSIISDTLELCRERFNNNGVSLISPPVLENLRINCRPVQISQVLLNLIANAFDSVAPNASSETQEEMPWVKIEVECLGPQIIISVTDSGKGIPTEVVDKIFQPFFTTKEVGKGTGLGLSISKGIAETHGGQLAYDSRAQNTRFILILPKYQEDPLRVTA